MNKTFMDIRIIITVLFGKDYSDSVVMIYYLPLVLVQTVLGFGNPSTEHGNVISCPTMACISLGS